MICGSCYDQVHQECDNWWPQERADMPPTWCDCQHREFLIEFNSKLEQVTQDNHEILKRLAER